MSSKECPQGDQPGWARFFVLWTVSGANYFAYATLKLALVLFAAHLTRSPLLVSGVVFVQLLPTFVFGLPAGVLVDRRADGGSSDKARTCECILGWSAERHWTSG
jgi:hypothetical protein